VGGSGRRAGGRVWPLGGREGLAAGRAGGSGRWAGGRVWPPGGREGLAAGRAGEPNTLLLDDLSELQKVL
jgi:hypothetical protein